jgi:hypothetical protein
MLISETLPANGIPRSVPVKSLYKRTMVVVAPLLLAIELVLAGAPAATTALASVSNFAPCGDTPGFCPNSLVVGSEQP